MSINIEHLCKELFRADAVEKIETIQSLWSGYGSISRWLIKGKSVKSVIVKHIDLNGANSHPRGWNTNLSHERKVKSYQVEMEWYTNYARKTNAFCRIPQCYHMASNNNEQVIILEDLDRAGFPIRRSILNFEETKPVINWLANFHAVFMNETTSGLWEQGTYWHLDTRPDEYKAMPGGTLKQAAKAIDKRLSQSHFQTLLHGDAKVANFCFSETMDAVAAVDFQYIGKGCGMKDLAYFVGSCIEQEDLAKHEEKILVYYFEQLKQALKFYQKSIDFNALEKEGRDLYPFAWADFIRFLYGWMPEHQKINTYSRSMVNKAVTRINY